MSGRMKHLDDDIVHIVQNFLNDIVKSITIYLEIKRQRPKEPQELKRI